jgi:hypothetical protein
MGVADILDMAAHVAEFDVGCSGRVNWATRRWRLSGCATRSRRCRSPCWVNFTSGGRGRPRAPPRGRRGCWPAPAVPAATCAAAKRAGLALRPLSATAAACRSGRLSVAHQHSLGAYAVRHPAVAARDEATLLAAARGPVPGRRRGTRRRRRRRTRSGRRGGVLRRTRLPGGPRRPERGPRHRPAHQTVARRHPPGDHATRPRLRVPRLRPAPVVDRRPPPPRTTRNPTTRRHPIQIKRWPPPASTSP